MKLKTFNFWSQVLLLTIYVVVSPFLFGILYPTTGDVALIWIWVVMVTGISSLLSLVVFIIVDVLLPPEKSYWAKGLIPLSLSFYLMDKIGSGLNSKMEPAFLLGNISLLVILFVIYGIVFFRRAKAHKGRQ